MVYHLLQKLEKNLHLFLPNKSWCLSCKILHEYKKKLINSSINFKVDCSVIWITWVLKLIHFYIRIPSLCIWYISWNILFQFFLNMSGHYMASRMTYSKPFKIVEQSQMRLIINVYIEINICCCKMHNILVDTLKNTKINGHF